MTRNQRRPTQSSPGPWRRLLPLLTLVTALATAGGTTFAFWATSASGSAQSEAQTLNAPGALSVSGPTGTTLSLSWSNSLNLPTSGGSPDGYDVFRSTTSGSQGSEVTSGGCASPVTQTAGTTSCTNSGLVPGTTYYYEVEAVYDSWVSSADSQQSGPTPKETPSISTSTSMGHIMVGGSLYDQAMISGGYDPTGSLTWKVYASTDTSCTSPLFSYSYTQPVSGDSTYAGGSAGSVTPTSPGSYIWGFSYSGDGSNNSVGGCGGTNEAFTVTQATPSISTTAGSSVSVGNSVSDTATLAQGYNETGTITYTLYGPSPTASCSGDEVQAVTNNSVNGNGSYLSPSITPPEAGTYWWIASYGGDTNNTSAADTCGSESTSVTKVTPTITTTTSTASLTVGGSLNDQAMFSGGYDATGTLTWHIYASSNSSCSSPLFSYGSSVTVSGNKGYSSPTSFTTTEAGAYMWGVSYNGDVNNNAVSVCGGSSETFTVNLKLSPPTLTSATVGASYSQTVTASGGTSPYSYSISSGNLPAGLSLGASTGTISGTPTAGSSFSFTVSAQDSASPKNTGSQAYTLTVNAPTITLSPSTLPNGIVGTAYSQTITASGGTSPYTFSVISGSLSGSGLTLSSGGVLSGTPTTAGTYSFTIQAKDSSTGTGPYTGSQAYTLTEVGNHLAFTTSTTSPVDGAASTTPNLGPITVELLNGSNVPIDAGTGGVTVTLASSGGGTGVFGASQFDATTETTVTVANGSSTSAPFYYGNNTVGAPTITASASGYTSATQQETITTAPAGLSLTSITDSGGTITCLAPSGDTTSCSGSMAQNGSFTAEVDFVNSSSSPVVYSTTQSSTITVDVTHGSGGGTVTIAAGASTSSTTFTANASGASTTTVKVTFGPYTINISATA